MEKIETFEDLDVWKKAQELRIAISGLVKKFPIEEKFELTRQMIKSSRSVSANIAEGFGRFHYQENIQFSRQARGSLSETLEHLICAKDEGYIDSSIFEKYEKLLKELDNDTD